MASKKDAERFILYKKIVDGMKFTKLFINNSRNYCFQTEYPLNTNWSVIQEFLIRWKVPIESIEIDDKNIVSIKHPTFDFKLKLNVNDKIVGYEVETNIEEY